MPISERSQNANNLINLILAYQMLKATLALVDLPVRANYRSGEVRAILSIGVATFWRLLRAYGRDENGRLRTPNCLESSVLGKQRRIAYTELVDYFRRNDGARRDLESFYKGGVDVIRSGDRHGKHQAT